MRHRHLDHEVPFWVTENPDLFITICTQPRGTNQLCLPEAGNEVLNAIEYYHVRNRWFCHIAVLMPDHIHFLLSFPDVPSYARVVGEWKKYLVKKCGIAWQENFFDHRIRGEDGDKYKSDYIWENPVRAGLIEKAEDWPYTWLPKERG